MKKWLTMHIDASLAYPSTPSDLTIWAARCNEENHKSLYVQLVSASEQSGFAAEEAAERLGVDVETFEDALQGHRDMTMMELRLLAASIDAVVEFKVTPARGKRTGSSIVQPVMTLVQKWNHGDGEKSWSVGDEVLARKQA